MLRVRLLLPVLAGLLMPALAACDSASSNVGIGLVEGGGEPIVRKLQPSVLDTTTFSDVTGAVPRVLAGRVDDPLVGTLSATGYADFTFGFDTTDTSPITGVVLRLARDYVYGDTLSEVTLDVHDLTDDWNAAGTRADTTLPLGGLVTTATFSPLDSLVSIPLPASWIAANDTTLRSTAFGTIFHGLALKPASRSSVVGFDFAGSGLRVFTERDTFDYAVSRTLSGVTRSGAPSLPAGRLLLQDGAGPFLRFNFDFSALDETPLNGAIVRFFADTLSMQANTPTNFVRPRQRTLQLVRVVGDDAFVVTTATLTGEGHYRFSAPALSQVLQQAFFGVLLFDHFELRVPFSDNTLNAILLFDAASGETAPEALLTISSSDT